MSDKIFCDPSTKKKLNLADQLYSFIFVAIKVIICQLIEYYNYEEAFSYHFTCTGGIVFHY